MPNHTSLLAVLGTLGGALAQSVGVSLTAVAPLPLQLSNGVTTVSSSVPAGPMSNWGGAEVTLPGVAGPRAGAEWYAFATNQYSFTWLIHGVDAGGLPTVSGHSGPHQIRVEYTAATSRAVTLQLSRTTQASAGAPWPTVAIDYDDDGVIDIADLPVAGATHAATFGPQPLRVRVVLDAALAGQGFSGTEVALLLLPDNDLTLTQPVAGCAPPSPPPPPPFLQPSFDDRGLDLSVGYGGPGVLVFGFGAQPALLAMNGLVPCILLPSPDVVLFAPAPFHLPLPASVRPVAFFVQGVEVTAAGLRTTDGYLVQAN